MSIKIQCSYCKRDVLVRSQGKYIPKYCSRECYQLALPGSVTISCEQCGRDCIVPSSVAAKRKYCSIACTNLAFRKPQTITYREDYCEVQMTGGVAILDTVDEDLHEQSWHLQKGYVRGTISGRRILLHRAVMERALGVAINPSQQIDHQDRDPLNNRRKNLRFATRAQNMANKTPAKNKTTSKYVGIYLQRNRTSWSASIRHDGVVVYIGTFHTELDAAYVRDQFAIVLHGEFAYLNVL